MTPIDYALWFVFGLILVWVLGGVALRLGGLLFIFGGGLSMARDPHGGALIVLVLGASCWLLGHWHYALRHHEFKSPLARYLFAAGHRPGPTPRAIGRSRPSRSSPPVAT